MQSAAFLRCCVRRFGTDIRNQWNVSGLLAKHKCKYFQCTRIQPITLSAYNFVAKKVTPDPEKEVIKNKGGKKSKYGGYVDKKQNNRTKSLGTIDVWRDITVAELAKAFNVELECVQEAMLYVKNAKNIEPNARLEDIQIIKEIACKCGFKVRTVSAPTQKSTTESTERDVFPRPPASFENLKPRPPVVTVMGHVDHGKTTLLDTLRGASVAEGEAGGITQHIGAFTVTLENGEKVTFLDTPGHAAFSSMRARGADCTDIIVLVVAAEDGVMQQTREVIQLAKDGNVPIIVAINKIDLPNADIEATKRGLIQMGIALEGHGGDVQCVNISALHGTNLDLLAESITAQATVMDLKSEYTGLVEGVVIESKTDVYRGKLSTAIITRGTLQKGSILVGGQAWAKVRAMFDHNNQPIHSVTPGMPVEILGWRELPFAGDQILEVENEKKAHSVMTHRHHAALHEKAEVDLEFIRKKESEHLVRYHEQRAQRIGRRKPKNAVREKTYVPDDETPKLNIILKGDVHGSVEAILDVLDTYDANDKCRMSIVHYGVGEITEGDIELAKVFNSIIYAFSIRVPPKRPPGVIIREYNIIYRLIENVIEEINARLPEVDVPDVTGTANVLQIFQINDKRKKLAVMGCRCTKGSLKKKLKFKLIRNDEVIYDGTLSSMRHLKTEVDSIKANVECGLQLTDQEIEPKEGDIIVCYSLKKEKQTFEWNPGF